MRGAHCEPDHDRLHARLEQCRPGTDREERARQTGPKSDSPGDEHYRIETRDDERHAVERLRVNRNQDERDEVVNDDDREHERAQAVRKVRPGLPRGGAYGANADVEKRHLVVCWGRDMRHIGTAPRCSAGWRRGWPRGARAPRLWRG
jgi:hypothetical protein